MTCIKAIVVCVVLATSAGLCVAKGWRGLIPLHSTCDDAKRVLGISKCETGSYDFKDERAFIWFSDRPCADGWNVPTGTVTNIEVFPKRNLQLTDINVDPRTMKREPSESATETVRYVNENEGLVVNLYLDGNIKSIAYIPNKLDQYLRYPRALENQSATGGDPHAILKFDEYGELIASKEHKRLDNFALRLQNEPNTHGYIIAYAGRRARPGEARMLIERAKNYLVSNHLIQSSRITTVDGGFREGLTVELFISGKNGPPPVVSPTVCPTEIHIIKDGTKKTNKRSLGRALGKFRK